MKKSLLPAVLLFCVILFSGCHSTSTQVMDNSTKAGTLTSMKGWELYSWEESDGWYFALVLGTNRNKTFEEISSAQVAVRDLEPLKAKLSQFAAGEFIFWTDHYLSKTHLPPEDIIDEVRAFCKSRRLELTVYIFLQTII